MVAEIDDLGDAQGGNIGQHCFQRDAVAMNIGDSCKLHPPTSVWSADDATLRECSEAVRFSYICKAPAS
jgi:hypothetical protein